MFEYKFNSDFYKKLIKLLYNETFAGKIHWEISEPNDYDIPIVKARYDDIDYTISQEGGDYFRIFLTNGKDSTSYHCMPLHGENPLSELYTLATFQAGAPKFFNDISTVIQEKGIL